MRSVPRPGECVALKVSSSDNRREDNETVRAPLDSSLVAQAAEATERLGLRLAGVDIVSVDPHRPLEENGGVIIEVNCTPGLAYHYHVGVTTAAGRRPSRFRSCLACLRHRETTGVIGPSRETPTEVGCKVCSVSRVERSKTW